MKSIFDRVKDIENSKEEFIFSPSQELERHLIEFKKNLNAINGNSK